MQQKRREIRGHVHIRVLISKGHHKQFTIMRTLGVTALERSVAKQFATGGLNPV
jgi:hypothetical protein